MELIYVTINFENGWSVSLKNSGNFLPDNTVSYPMSSLSELCSSELFIFFQPHVKSSYFGPRISVHTFFSAPLINVFKTTSFPKFKKTKFQYKPTGKPITSLDLILTTLARKLEDTRL